MAGIIEITIEAKTTDPDEPVDLDGPVNPDKPVDPDEPTEDTKKDEGITGTKTGDSSNIILWISIAVAAMLAAGVVFFKMFRRES